MTTPVLKLRKHLGAAALAALTLTACGVDSPATFAEFVDQAAMGHLPETEAGLAAHPDWASARLPDGGRTALHGVGYTGHVAVARALVAAGADPAAAATEDGDTPLHEAADGGRADMVRYLLKADVPVDVRNLDGRTPLHETVWSSDAQRDVVTILLDAGADVNAATLGGFTPLLLASIRGHVDTARLLLERGARVDAVGVDGRTPLSAARDGGHDAVVELLVAAGAR